jgi:hypothetical protein
MFRFSRLILISILILTLSCNKKSDSDSDNESYDFLMEGTWSISGCALIDTDDDTVGNQPLVVDSVTYLSNNAIQVIESADDYKQKVELYETADCSGPVKYYDDGNVVAEETTYALEVTFPDVTNMPDDFVIAVFESGDDDTYVLVTRDGNHMYGTFAIDGDNIATWEDVIGQTGIQTFVDDPEANTQITFTLED